jgi:hypothetical protein
MENQIHLSELENEKLAEIAGLMNSPAYLLILNHFKQEAEISLNILLSCPSEQIQNRVFLWRVAETAYQKISQIPKEAQETLNYNLTLEENKFSQL